MVENKKGLIAVIVGAGLVAIGYAIYQCYPNEITENAGAIKEKMKALFSKKQGEIVVVEEIIVPIEDLPTDDSGQDNNDYADSDTSGNDDSSQMGCDNGVNIFQPTWLIPQNMPSNMFTAQNVSDSALDEVGGLSAKIYIIDDTDQS